MKILTKLFPIDALKGIAEMRTPFLEDQKKIRKIRCSKMLFVAQIIIIKPNNEDYSTFLGKKMSLGRKSLSPLVPVTAFE